LKINRGECLRLVRHGIFARLSIDIFAYRLTFLRFNHDRISLHSDDGMAPILTDFVPVPGDNELQSLKKLVEKINKLVAEAANAKSMRAAGATSTSSASTMQATGVVTSQPRSTPIIGPAQVAPMQPSYPQPQQQAMYMGSLPPAVHQAAVVSPTPAVYAVSQPHAPVMQMQMQGVSGPATVYGAPPMQPQLSHPQPQSPVYGAPPMATGFAMQQQQQQQQYLQQQHLQQQQLHLQQQQYAQQQQYRQQNAALPSYEESQVCYDSEL
jgi:hypothetical protein